MDRASEHPLASALLKLDRARKHIDDFESGFRESVEAKTYEPVHEMNLETGHYRIVFAPLEPPPYLSTLLGDGIQNARAALEHVMWALVLGNRDGVDPPDPRVIQFPLDNWAKRFNSRTVLNFLLPDQRAAVQSHQPYIRRGERQNSALGLLRDLSDRDKHRRLALLAHALDPDHDPIVSGPTFENCGQLIEPFLIATGGVPQPGTELASFYFTWLRPESRVHVKFEIGVTAAIVYRGRMWECWPLLDQILWNVRKAIRDFEPFFEPLPPERIALDARLHEKAPAP